MCDAIYIHIPFCIKKCGYCDFLSFSCEEKNSEDRKKYIENLIEEIKLYPKLRYNTVYFGGGTPSLLEVNQIKRILKELTIDEGAEITLEVNPQSVDLKKLKELRKIGINRISIGIQSFDDEKLKVLGRIHTKEIAIETYKNSRIAGFTNISIDLIFATPNQTIEELKKDLDIVEELDPDHISIYSLIWEEGTEFMKLLDNGRLKPIDNHLEAEMYELIIERLKKIGYTHYEISNFSKPKYESKHNSKYWENVDYIGVGLGASGYYNGVRYKNNIEFEEYYKNIDNKEKPILEEEIVNKKDQLENYYILGLRLLNKGVEVKLEEKVYLEKFKKLESEKYLVEENNRYKLTQKGFLVANDVFVEIME